MIIINIIRDLGVLLDCMLRVTIFIINNYKSSLIINFIIQY